MSEAAPVRRHLTTSLVKTAVVLGLAGALVALLLPRITGDYNAAPVLDSRTIVWFVMELHLMFAAFVLGVPIFAMIVEIVGKATGDEKYDRLAHEFTRLLAMAVMATAGLGVLGLAALIVFYPAFMRYLADVFSPTFWFYGGTIVSNGVLLVFYYYAWERMQGRLKWLHIGVGALLNVSGTVLMCIANAWGTFMMSPPSLADEAMADGTLVPLAAAIQNPLWWPINIHRLIANVAFGGAIAAAYAAIRFLTVRSEERRAHYDWMGYVGNFVAMWALIMLPFAGYWLGKEIYAYDKPMGTTLMGGAFSWLFIIQAVLIAALFICANYYMWLGLGRIPGGQRYYRYILAMEILIFVAMAVWMTPHTLLASLAEARRMGAAHHPLLGVLGVMSAKNTAANIAILTTFVSFVLYRRANKQRSRSRPRGGLAGPVFIAAIAAFPILFCTVGGFFSQGARASAELGRLEPRAVLLDARLRASDRSMTEMMGTVEELAAAETRLETLRRTPGVHHAAEYRVLAGIFTLFLAAAVVDMFLLRGRIGDFLQWTIMGTVAAIVLYYGVKGYFVPADVRIGYSVYQVVAVIFAIVSVIALDLYLFFGSDSLGPVQWGRMPDRSQYVLVLLAAVFTFTIGVMGFVRSGIRETWHVYGAVRDTSPEAYTPTMGYAVTVVAAATLTFFAMLLGLFWLGMRERGDPADA